MGGELNKKQQRITRRGTRQTVIYRYGCEPYPTIFIFLFGYIYPVGNGSNRSVIYSSQRDTELLHSYLLLITSCEAPPRW